MDNMTPLEQMEYLKKQYMLNQKPEWEELDEFGQPVSQSMNQNHYDMQNGYDDQDLENDLGDGNQEDVDNSELYKNFGRENEVGKMLYGMYAQREKPKV